MSKGEKSGPVLKDAPQHLSIQDITEQKAHLKKPKKNSEAIKSSEAKVFSIFNNIWDCIVILNSVGKVIEVNPAYCLMLGYSKDEILGTSFSKYIHPDYLKDLDRFQQQIETNRGVSLESVDIHKDGSSVPIEVRGISCTYLGQQVLLGVVRAISKQKQTPDAFRVENEELEVKVRERTQHLKDIGKLFEGIFSSLSEAVFVVDPATRKIISCNRAVEKIFGYAKEEVIGYNTEFLHVDREHYEQFGKKMIPALIVEGMFSIEICLKKKSGKIFHTENTVTEIKDEMGQPTALVSVVRDITERKDALKALRQSKEALRILAGRLLSSQEEESRRLARELHDDFTQRLAAVAIELGKLDITFPSSTDFVYKQIQEIKGQVVKLSTDLNNISRRLHPSIIDDLGLSAAIKSECIGFSHREEIQVEYDSKDLPSKFSNEVSLCLYRIVQEGLRNIVKHSQAKKVSITLTGSEDQVMLSIRDDGIGFDPTRIKKKAGLGLASMEERVRLVKGLLSIQSRTGQGTEINVLTPLSLSGDE